jgi:hypothetical protein
LGAHGSLLWIDPSTHVGRVRLKRLIARLDEETWLLANGDFLLGPWRASASRIADKEEDVSTDHFCDAWSGCATE